MAAFPNGCQEVGYSRVGRPGVPWVSSCYCLSHPSQAVPTALVHFLSEFPRTVVREVQVDYLGAPVQASLVAQMVKNLPAIQETQIQFLAWVISSFWATIL